jgi:hypothetical protein
LSAYAYRQAVVESICREAPEETPSRRESSVSIAASISPCCGGI